MKPMKPIQKIALGIVVVGEMIIASIIYKLSSPDNPRFNDISRYLYDGWLGEMDLSDHQQRFFRKYLGILGIVSLSHTFISYAFKSNFKQFTLIFCILFLFVLHGFNALKVIALISINYGITKSYAKSNIGVLSLWVWHIFMILTIQQIDVKVPYSQGLISQWIVYYKFNILRMISFTMDYKWSSSYSLVDKSNKKQSRIESSCKDFSFSSYLTYILYPPLYLAGPIITYNDFTTQSKVMSKTKIIENFKTVSLYAARFVLLVLSLELFSRFAYVNAITRDGKINGFHTYSSIELCIIGYLALMHIWLKLMVLWRFFRLWAMLDGIETDENMTRCMSNNYSTMDFWKHWHRSFNRWIVRYLYIPLGGSKTYVWNIWLVFSFVAIWHDIEIKLLVWGWVIALFIIPEYVCKSLFKSYRSYKYYDEFAAIGGVINIILMMSGNLVGYALGVDGTKMLLTNIVSNPLDFGFVLICVYFAVHLMFYFQK